MSKKSRERTPELEEIAAQLGSMNTQEEDTITIPVVEIFRQLKKYFLPWVLVAVIFAGLVFGGSMVVSSSKASPLTAMVGFTFDGIENGLDPNGNEFNANSLKSPAIIEETLSDLNMDVKKTVKWLPPIARPSPSPEICQIVKLGLATLAPVATAAARPWIVWNPYVFT